MRYTVLTIYPNTPTQETHAYVLMDCFLILFLLNGIGAKILVGPKLILRSTEDVLINEADVKQSYKGASQDKLSFKEPPKEARKISFDQVIL